MRLWPVAVLATLLATPLSSQAPEDPDAAQAWRAALAKAGREKKPILAFDRPVRCTGACASFEQRVLKHPAMECRLDEVVLVTRTVAGLQTPDLALYDRRGTLVARLGGLPRDTTAFGAMLEGIASVKPSLERAASLTESGGPQEGELELAAALMSLGRIAEARAAVDRAGALDMAIVVRAMLDANDGKLAEAMQALQALTAKTTTPDVAATAWMGIGAIHRTRGANDDAVRAYTTAAKVAEPGSGAHARASEALSALTAPAARPPGMIRVMPPEEQLVSGRQTIRTAVSSTRVARVVFSVDGQERAAVDRPPFSSSIDFGRVPQVSTIRAVAYDVNRREIGRDELTVNHAGEMFWIRLLEPRAGKASGKVRVTATLRAPAGRNVKRVVVSWNDAERAVIPAEPWQADLDLPKELGVLQVKAELDDGRTSEDAVLLNAPGLVEQADVPLVEIPVIVTEGDGSPSRVAAEDVVVREGRTRRTIESVTSGSEAPLTVGLVFDTSDSMCRSLRGVQDAAILFLDTALGPNDRAFLIAFDNDARLVQPPTPDRALLRQQIRGLRANGSTALYDALIVGLLQFEGVKGRRALIVFSDGDDRTSRFRAKDIAEMARRSNIPIYLIAAPAVARPNRGATVSRMPGLNDRFGTRASGDSEKWAEVFAYLMGVIRGTGGLVHHLENLAELPAVYEKIEAALRAQSLVVIRTAAGRSENDWRNIDVEVGGAKRDVRAPAGYYAPW